MVSVGPLWAATEYAEGGLAVARHPNDAAAQAYFLRSGLFAIGRPVLDYSAFLVLLAFLPTFHAIWRRIRGRRHS